GITQRHHGASKRFRIVRWHQYPLDAVTHQRAAARNIAREDRSAAARAFEQSTRQALAAARRQAADMICAPNGGGIARAAMPGDAGVAAPNLESLAREGFRVGGVRLAVKRKLDGRAFSTRAPRRRDRDVDPLRPEHAGHDRDLERRQGGHLAWRVRIGGDTGPPDDDDALILVRREAEKPRIIRIFEE